MIETKQLANDILALLQLGKEQGLTFEFQDGQLSIQEKDGWFSFTIAEDLTIIEQTTKIFLR